MVTEVRVNKKHKLELATGLGQNSVHVLAAKIGNNAVENGTRKYQKGTC